MAFAIKHRPEYLKELAVKRYKIEICTRDGKVIQEAKISTDDITAFEKAWNHAVFPPSVRVILTDDNECPTCGQEKKLPG